MRRYRLLRDGESGTVDIMLVLDTPQFPIPTTDMDAKIAMFCRQLPFKPNKNGLYMLAVGH